MLCFLSSELTFSALFWTFFQLTYSLLTSFIACRDTRCVHDKLFSNKFHKLQIIAIILAWNLIKALCESFSCDLTFLPFCLCWQHWITQSQPGWSGGTVLPHLPRGSSAPPHCSHCSSVLSSRGQAVCSNVTSQFFSSKWSQGLLLQQQPGVADDPVLLLLLLVAPGEVTQSLITLDSSDSTLTFP